MFRPIKNLFLSFLSLLIGMKVTIKQFFAPAITVQYPSEKKPMTKNFRGMVDLVPPDCVVCYQCIKICPVAALDPTHKQTLTPDNKKKLDITKFTFNGELCCYCGLCEEICPTDAIYLNNLYEVSAYSHSEMNNIDLMDANKYKQFGYTQAPLNYKKEEKAAPAAVAAAASVAVAPAPSKPAEPSSPGGTKV